MSLLEALQKIGVNSSPAPAPVLPISGESDEVFAEPLVKPPRPATQPAEPRTVAKQPTVAAVAEVLSEPLATREDDVQGQIGDLPHEIGNLAHEPVFGTVDSPRTTRADPGRYAGLVENILAEWSSRLPASLVFTSPTDGAGKTVTVARVAILLAERMPGVIAVDADLRWPGLTRRFGIEVEQGLVEAASGEVPWQETIWRTPLAGLSILPVGGSSTDNPFGVGPETLDIAALIGTLRRHYRLVLIDAPSLSHAQAAPLARSCDGTYLVVKLGHTPRRAARQAARILHACGACLSGCVVRGPV